MRMYSSIGQIGKSVIEDYKIFMSKYKGQIPVSLEKYITRWGRYKIYHSEVDSGEVCKRLTPLTFFRSMKKEESLKKEITKILLEFGT